MVTIVVTCVQINYTNLSRYSDSCEKTYRRHFDKGLGLEGLDHGLIEQATGCEDTLLIAVDCTFLTKSGARTYGL